jgi:hypothetical protein
MNMTEIIKVQRPPSSKGLGSPWLLYDKNRARVEPRAEASINEDVKAAMRSAPKGYFQAEWTDAGWKIGDPVVAQDW